MGGRCVFLCREVSLEAVGGRKKSGFWCLVVLVRSVG